MGAAEDDPFNVWGGGEMVEQEKEGLGLREDSRQVITCKKGCEQGSDLPRSWRTDVVQDRAEVGGGTGKVPRDQLLEVRGIVGNQATKWEVT